MGSITHSLILPIEFMMQASSNNVRNIAIKTIPSAFKTGIKRVLQSVYGFQVEKMRTLNMQGKKKKMAGRLMASPDYKKAYVTLKNLSSLSPHLFNSHSIKGKNNDHDTKKSNFVHLTRLQ